MVDHSNSENSLFEIRSRNVNGVLIALSLAAVPSITVAIWRSQSLDWQPIIVLQIAAACIIWIVTILRSKIHFYVRGAVVVALMFLLAIGAFMNFALTGGGLSFSVLSVIFATVFFGMRGGLVTLAILVVSIATIGYAYSTQQLGLGLDLNNYNVQRANWVNTLVGFAVLTSCALVSIAWLNQELVVTAALRTAATRDYLTGMVNRRYFFEMATPIYANAKRNNSSVLIAMIDIDHFKIVNDTYGHDMGDKVLVSVADALEKNTRSTDIIARFGGEEFCLIAPAIQLSDVNLYLDKLRVCIEGLSFTADTTTFQVTTSIGATSHIHNSLEQMINEADTMLYNAKEGGRNQVVTAAQ